ncbi:MAG: uracil-DNA glycosylase [Candidatus Marinimicrobia bacterium]|nr:uracil-DNA glycosylase [Candidatus Neomarinimicrobiota bacterium]
MDNLAHNPDGPIFNPWYDVDPQNDIGEDSPQIRRRQLEQYLTERIETAKYLLIGEAIGYQGGHFSGMAMTSERILLGYKKKDGVNPDHVFRQISPKRTSKPEIKEKGFSENTATIVWKIFAEQNLDTYQFVIWNAFSWHPYDESKGLLSNRTPTSDELESARPNVKMFLDIFNGAEPLAVGEHAHSILSNIGLQCEKLRHPAHGGANDFRDGLLNKLK